MIQTMKQFPQFKVVAVCDVIPDRLEKAMQNADPEATAYTDYQLLLDDREVDAVVIATPLSMHHQMALDALDVDGALVLDAAGDIQQTDAWDVALTTSLTTTRAP